jgi:hypothetical protein
MRNLPSKKGVFGATLCDRNSEKLVTLCIDNMKVNVWVYLGQHYVTEIVTHLFFPISSHYVLTFGKNKKKPFQKKKGHDIVTLYIANTICPPKRVYLRQHDITEILHCEWPICVSYTKSLYR